MQSTRHQSQAIDSSCATPSHPDSLRYQRDCQPRRIVISAILAVAGLSVISCETQTDSASAPDSRKKMADFQGTHPSPADLGYVGSETCASCHESIAALYRAHPMGYATDTVPPPQQSKTIRRHKSRHPAPDSIVLKRTPRESFTTSCCWTRAERSFTTSRRKSTLPSDQASMDERI